MLSMTAVGTKQHQLAEGPFWCNRSKALYWVDIPAMEVWCWHQASGLRRSWHFDKKVSAVFTTQSYRLLLCMADGVAYFDPETEVLEYLCKLDEDRPNNRLNDAKCDRNGTLFVGSMDDNEELKSGRLWRVDQTGKRLCLLDNIGISNTLAWDYSRHRFYFADSMTGKIHLYPWPEFEDVRTSKPFVQTPEGVGPDGSCLDSEGNLWNAMWGAGCVVCYSPEGVVKHLLELPFKCPTSCAFGGEDGSTLFITSASVGEKDPMTVPFAGQVVAIDLFKTLGIHVKGAAGQSFAGK